MGSMNAWALVTSRWRLWLVLKEVCCDLEGQVEADC